VGSSPTPLRIERLELGGFRNLERLALVPGPRFNVFHGDNGAGKSNLLEAIHYLGALRSFRGAKSEDLVAIGRDEAQLDARVLGDLSPRRFRIAISRTAPRKVAIDGKRPRTLALYCAELPIVIFHPGDLELAAGAADKRRAYLDRVLEQMDPTYAAVHAEYDKALRSRNRLLRDETVDRRAIAVYDELLATRGAIVGSARASILEDLGPRIEAAFAAIVGEHLELRVRYRARVPPNVAAMRSALTLAYAKDVARGFTADGPHADEIVIELSQVVARHHASQGQHRSMALAMKLAELDILTERTGRVPLLLLDDVSSELDRERNRRLFERIARVGGQVFLTTTQPELIRLESDRTDFRIANGSLRAE
jgi:DNA replication and repair protein RecF